MGVRETIQWVRTWAPVADRGHRSLSETTRWLGQWVPFGCRTVGYGAVSLTAGPLTADHVASAWAMRQWARSSLKGLGIEVDLAGTERVPQCGLVYASNHQSLLDILVLAAVLPGDLKWVAKDSLMNVPFLGWHLRLAGHVAVNRGGGRRAATEAIEKFVGVLRQGKPLLIFPEGTRSEDGTLKPFKNGGFHAAIRAGVPVVPVSIEGTHDMLGKHAAAVDSSAVDAHAHSVRVRIGRPIDPSTLPKGSERVQCLSAKTREAILALRAGP